jgi:hypothetical protein
LGVVTKTTLKIGCGDVAQWLSMYLAVQGPGLIPTPHTHKKISTIKLVQSHVEPVDGSVPG